MKVSNVQIMNCLLEVFPEADGIDFTPASTLGELPEWDSMAAVNLQTALQQQFGSEVPLELLSDETKLEEISAFLNTVDSRETVC